MKIAKVIKEIKEEIDKCQFNIHHCNDNLLEKWKWLSRKEALYTALEIIKSNI